MQSIQPKRYLLSDLDPRMRLLIVIVFTTASYLSQNIWVLMWNYVLIVALYLFRGLWKGALKTTLIFTSFLLIDSLCALIPNTGVKSGIGMILFMLERMSVFFIMAGWIADKMRVNDFITAMQNMHVPKGITITLAVVFRYLPTVKDEFRSIKDTMQLRGIDITFKNVMTQPLKTCEYAIIPLVMRSLTIADELSASAITRGLNLERKRTSYREVRLYPQDILFTGCIIAAVLCGPIVHLMM